MHVFVVVFAREWRFPIELIEQPSQQLILCQFVSRSCLGAAKKVFTIAPDDVRAKTVKGVNGDFVGVCADYAAESLAHVCRAAVGKCEAQNIRRQRVGLA